MKKSLRDVPVVKARTETTNPLWVITVTLAIFFTAAAALIALA